MLCSFSFLYAIVMGSYNMPHTEKKYNIHNVLELNYSRKRPETPDHQSRAGFRGRSGVFRLVCGQILFWRGATDPCNFGVPKTLIVKHAACNGILTHKKKKKRKNR